MGRHTVRRKTAIAAGCSIVVSICTASEPPQKIDVRNTHAEIIDEVAVPIAHEVFASLDKLGQRSWGQQIFKEKTPFGGTRPELALRFGFVIANGFIAVAAEAPEDVERVGRDVLRLARALNLEEPVVAHAQAIIDGARARDWEATRTELDRARETVREEMRKLRDHDIAELVSLGGWICGTHAVAGTLASDYSEEGAELLRQPELISQLSNNFDDLAEEKKRAPVFAGIAPALRSMQTFFTVPVVSPTTVVEIHSITDRLASSILPAKEP